MSAAAVALKNKNSAEADIGPKFKPRPEIGFVQSPNLCFNHRSRLLSGNAEYCIVDLVFAETYSALRPKGADAPLHSRPLHHNEFADFARTKPNVMNHVLLSLVDRKVILRKQAAAKDFKKGESPSSLRGYFVYWIEPKSWKSLPDRVEPERKPNASADNLDTDEGGDDNSNTAAEVDKLRRQHLHLVPEVALDEPIRLRARQSSPAYAPRVAIEKIQFKPRHDGILVFPTTYLGRLQIEFALDEEAAEALRSWQRDKANKKRSPDVSKHSEKNRSVDSTAVSGSRPSNFGMFQALYLEAGKQLSDKLWEETEGYWKRLPVSGQIAAVQGMRDLRDWVLSGRLDVQLVPKANNYLRNEMWVGQEAPRASKASKLASESERYDRFTEALDKRRGR
jgi:hypothetical protein